MRNLHRLSNLALLGCLQCFWLFYFSLIHFYLFNVVFVSAFSRSVVSDSLWPHGLYNPPGSSVCGIFQARTLKWVTICYSREASRPRDQTHVSYVSYIGRQVLYHYCHVESFISNENAHIIHAWLDQFPQTDYIHLLRPITEHGQQPWSPRLTPSSNFPSPPKGSHCPNFTQLSFSLVFVYYINGIIGNVLFKCLSC